MPRIEPVNQQTASAATQELLTSVRSKMGGVPNIIATMATSTAVAQSYLGFSQALSAGSLSPRLRELIALTVAEANRCGYCVAAHTTLGKGVGLSEAATLEARDARSSDFAEQAALEFALAVVSQRGAVSDDEFDRIRQAGFTDGEISEIVAHVALNLFTNYFNLVAQTEIDFPAPPRRVAEAGAA